MRTPIQAPSGGNIAGEPIADEGISDITIQDTIVHDIIAQDITAQDITAQDITDEQDADKDIGATMQLESVENPCFRTLSPFQSNFFKPPSPNFMDMSFTQFDLRTPQIDSSFFNVPNFLHGYCGTLPQAGDIGMTTANLNEGSVGQALARQNSIRNDFNPQGQEQLDLEISRLLAVSPPRIFDHPNWRPYFPSFWELPSE